ncbi:hypothetical protein [Acrocarpospora catenulata]|uniref:hypothetical protein n=1 Tax=Acrocarpospora catenulata TaxID=2836182 RepID=UPI001BDACA5E|nr:hypothetical protein [Acrocarpospora catenulata]
MRFGKRVVVGIGSAAVFAVGAPMVLAGTAEAAAAPKAWGRKSRFAVEANRRLVR